MLIEFSVANYRSFRERQTFSLLAAPRLGRKENIFVPELDGEEGPPLLKAAAIYGPNASGKSNLIKALRVVQLLARLESSAQQPVLPVNPFRFDPALQTEPSRFEFHFIAERQRYKFKLALTAERIIEEELVCYPRGKEVLLYSRRYLDQHEKYVFGDQLEGGRDVQETWRKLTSPQRLFMAQAVANSSEELRQLRIPFAWLTSHIDIWCDNNMSALVDFTRMIKDKKSMAADIVEFVRDLDIPVNHIDFEAPRPLLSEGDSAQRKILLRHQSALGEADFEFEEESFGTQNLIGFFFPWILLTHPLSSTRVLVVDELDTSLHPGVVAALVRKHIQLEKAGAQLIFTTHDTHLMDTKLLRRDQLWLTERDRSGATRLMSIHEFEGRESEDVEKRYYEGRYRGLPILREG